MERRSFGWWRWVRLLGGLALVAFVVHQVGSGPFRQGIQAVNPAALVTATLIGVMTTWCCAWRWRAMAAGVGADVPMRIAVAGCYRSQFLNATLPGGIVGDVHRAYRHGIRPVVLERVAGQVTQVLVALSVLVPAARPYAPIAAAGLAVTALLTILLRRKHLPSMTVSVWVGVAVTSALVLAGHVLLFIVAARLSGTAPPPLVTLVPLALAALMAMLLPVQVAGWGPREVASAWAFSVAGLTPTQGVAVAATYGVLSLASTLPGGVLMLAGFVRTVRSRRPALASTE